MAEVGDHAPDFAAPLANGDVVPFRFSNHFDEAPVVLAFYPGAFTGVCTTQLCTFEERIGVFNEIGASVYGVSVDTPFSLNEFRTQEGLSFGLISDHDKKIIEAYDVRDNFEDIGYYGLAKRAVLVIDEDGAITYRWVADNPGQEPNYEEIEAAARAAVRSQDTTTSQPADQD